MTYGEQETIRRWNHEFPYARLGDVLKIVLSENQQRKGIPVLYGEYERIGKIKKQEEMMGSEEKNRFALQEFMDHVMTHTKTIQERRIQGLEELTREEIMDAIQRESHTIQCAVDGAMVRCDCAVDARKEIHVFKLTTKGFEYMSGRVALNHKDIHFDDNFGECKNSTDRKCKIKVVYNRWQEFDRRIKIGDGYAVNVEYSFLICSTGNGIISFADSGQGTMMMEERIERELDAKLDAILCESAFIEMKWDLLNINPGYGNDFFGELKKYMKKYDLIDETSIMMFLATIRHESGSARLLLEEGNNSDFLSNGYTDGTHGAGLIQITAEAQKIFLEYMIKEIEENPDLSQEEKNSRVSEINNSITNGKTAYYIADYYPIESAVWYWTELEVFFYKEPQKNSLNSKTLDDFVIKHSQDNLDNTFACTQMKINGTEYYAEALHRIAECETSATLEEVSQGTLNSCGVGHRTHCCFQIKLTAPDGTITQHHEYGPRGWESRKEAYDDAEVFFATSGIIR